MPDKYACNKTVFNTEKEAEERLNEIKYNIYDRREIIPIRYYKYSKCQLFHLTSKSEEEFELNKKKARRRWKNKRKRIIEEAYYWLKKFKIKDDV